MTTGRSPARAPRDELISIQYIRAVAAIMVIVWHTGWSRTVLGQSGVDLFFVVSGFIMMLVSGRDALPARFGLARLARIVPLYWVVTIIVALLDRPAVSKLLTSLVFWPDGEFPVVIQGWSLNLEMSYYVFFALALFVPIRWRLLCLAAEIAFICLVLPLLAPPSDPVRAWSNPLAFEFLAGAALHVAWRRHYIPVGASAWLAGAAGVFVLGTSHFIGGAPAGWARVAFWGVPALVVVGAGLGIERSGQLPKLPLLSLGAASYAIYLTHFLALRFVAEPLHTLWAPVALVIALVWTCFVGWLVHRAFELPAHRFTSKLLRTVWPKPQPA